MKKWWDRRSLSGKLTLITAAIMSALWVVMAGVLVLGTAQEIYDGIGAEARKAADSTLLFASTFGRSTPADDGGTRPGAYLAYCADEPDEAVLAEHDAYNFNQFSIARPNERYVYTTEVKFGIPSAITEHAAVIASPHIMLSCNGGDRQIVLDELAWEEIQTIHKLLTENDETPVSTVGEDTGFYFYPSVLTVGNRSFTVDSAQDGTDLFEGTTRSLYPVGLTETQLRWYYDRIHSGVEISQTQIEGSLLSCEIASVRLQGHGEELYIRIVMMATPLRSAIHEHAETVLRLAALCILCGLLFFRAVRRIVVRPIMETAAGAKSYSADDLSGLALDHSRSDEIGALNRSLDEMAARLRGQWEAERELERQRQEFLAAASHDLKTPLALIGGSAEAIAQEIDPENNEKYLAAIERECGRMNTLVSQMLAASRLGQLEYLGQVDRFDLATLLRELCREREILFGARPVHKQLPPFLMYQGDRNALGRAIGAILDNAAQYSAPDAEIEVTLVRKSSGWRLTIENEGDPVAVDDLPRLFELFYRADRARARENGSGIGLAVAARVFDLHDLTYRAENTATGVCFTVETCGDPTKKESKT